MTHTPAPRHNQPSLDGYDIPGRIKTTGELVILNADDCAAYGVVDEHTGTANAHIPGRLSILGCTVNRQRGGDMKTRHDMTIGEAVETAHEILVLGDPPDEEQYERDGISEDDVRRHNCDAMGCGAFHVLYRFTKPYNTKVGPLTL